MAINIDFQPAGAIAGAAFAGGQGLRRERDTRAREQSRQFDEGQAYRYAALYQGRDMAAEQRAHQLQVLDQQHSNSIDVLTRQLDGYAERAKTGDKEAMRRLEFTQGEIADRHTESLKQTLGIAEQHRQSGNAQAALGVFGRAQQQWGAMVGQWRKMGKVFNSTQQAEVDKMFKNMEAVVASKAWRPEQTAQALTNLWEKLRRMQPSEATQVFAPGEEPGKTFTRPDITVNGAEAPMTMELGDDGQYRPQIMRGWRPPTKSPEEIASDRRKVVATAQETWTTALTTDALSLVGKPKGVKVDGEVDASDVWTLDELPTIKEKLRSARGKSPAERFLEDEMLRVQAGITQDFGAGGFAGVPDREFTDLAGDPLARQGPAPLAEGQEPMNVELTVRLATNAIRIKTGEEPDPERVAWLVRASGDPNDPNYDKAVAMLAKYGVNRGL